jgi:hypothetical protein
LGSTFSKHSLDEVNHGKKPAASRPQAQQVFLAVFLHTIGFPLLGDQFPDKFGY